MNNFLPIDQVRELYDRFDAPVIPYDCGQKCAPLNPTGKPFCCDICQAVPAAYQTEWQYLQANTELWHTWRGDECSSEPPDTAALQADTPENMVLLACQGPKHCQRQYRAISCRQFPFFPYVTSGLRFIGLAYEWEFEGSCWVIHHLEDVKEEYRRQFLEIYDELFRRSHQELESYAIRSDQMRALFAGLRRRIPILHRNGGIYRLSPTSERLERLKSISSQPPEQTESPAGRR